MVDIVRIIALVILGWVGGAAINTFAKIIPMHRELRHQKRGHYGEPRQFLGWFLFIDHFKSCGLINTSRMRIIVSICIGIVIWLYINTTSLPEFLLGYGLMIYLGTVAVIDIEHRKIIHATSLFGALLGFLVGIYIYGPGKTLLGGGIGLIIMWFLYVFGHQYMAIKSKLATGELNQEAIGFGDVIFGGIIGLILGWPNIVAGLALAILLFGITGIGMIFEDKIFKRSRDSFILPYAPFMIASAIIILMIGNYIYLILPFPWPR